MRVRVSVLRIGFLGLCVLVIVHAIIAVPIMRGLEVMQDVGADSAFRLAAQLIDATKTLLGLATGVLGLMGFLFSDKVSTYWQRSSRRQQDLILLGGAAACCSIITGLLAMWALMSLSADSTVRGGIPRVLALQVLELAEVGTGLVLLTIVAVRAVRSNRLAAGGPSTQ